VAGAHPIWQLQVNAGLFSTKSKGGEKFIEEGGGRGRGRKINDTGWEIRRT